MDGGDQWRLEKMGCAKKCCNIIPLEYVIRMLQANTYVAAHIQTALHKPQGWKLHPEISGGSGNFGEFFNKLDQGKRIKLPGLSFNKDCGKK